ncbi:MAG TPA: DUF255 domain-containing protein [Opitutaceae bacterium]|jgi:hypothetical protein
MRRILAPALAIALCASSRAAAPVAWQPWSDAAFAQARREHKFVIMDLEAVWCHWCHVMDETTYRDPNVGALLASRYVAVKVDQDSRPDLSNRYEDYGWPATVVFAADGSEIVRRRGYIDPAQMARMLQAIIDDPSPGPSVTSPSGGSAPSGASAAAPGALRQRVIAGYDRSLGGWSLEHRFLDADNVEYCLRAASRGDAEASAIARDMLRLETRLLDPAWGGVYQYSAEGDWDHPHFEKIMSMQADNIRAYSAAADLWPDWGYEKPAASIVGYLGRFLTAPDGSFYTSQDADLVAGEQGGGYFSLGDKERRARGIPRVDTHRYARENGWAIRALCAYYAAAGDDAALSKAQAAARWALAGRALPGGGFRHGDRDGAGPYLGDTLAMGQAFLALYGSTGDGEWLAHAESAADFIAGHFGRGGLPGFATSAPVAGAGPGPRPQFDEQVALARFANLLGHASGRAADHAIAASALRWASAPDVAGRRHAYVGGLLLAVEELGSEPLHVTVVGPRGDARALALHRCALRAPSTYKLVEWWDKAAGPAPRGDAIFPDIRKPSAYLCANGACSAPVTDPSALSRRLAKAISVAGQE